MLQVLPSLRVAAFVLGEIKGLALSGELRRDGEAGEDREDTGVRSGSRRPSLGLGGQLASLAELAAAKALLQGEALRMAVTAVGCQMRGFFGWLHRMWYLLEGGSKVGPEEELVGELEQGPHVYYLGASRQQEGYWGYFA